MGAKVRARTCAGGEPTCWRRAAAAAWASKGSFPTLWRRLSHRPSSPVPEPAPTVLRLERALWRYGAPVRRPAPPSSPAAMLYRGQTLGLPATTIEGLREELQPPN